ncbi:MAG: SlyX family protein [Gammaproteobacteria bacterium]|nr:SlyX family protein [Gammaproteobacteria bacterium]MDH3446659.1 SlyX family protein [Gammaproteobacteria bacterium]
MIESLQARLDHLESLYTEQDHTIQALNDMVAQQDREISRLNLGIEFLKDQLKAVRSELAGDIGAEVEKPPHY